MWNRELQIVQYVKQLKLADVVQCQSYGLGLKADIISSIMNVDYAMWKVLLAVMNTQFDALSPTEHLNVFQLIVLVFQPTISLF